MLEIIQPNGHESQMPVTPNGCTRINARTTRRMRSKNVVIIKIYHCARTAQHAVRGKL